MAVALVSHSAPAASGVVSTPASIVTGNVIVFWGAHGGTLGAMPTGVTLKQAGNAQFIAWITTAAHIANGSPATYTFTSTTSVFGTHAAQFSGTDLTDPFDVTPTTNNTGTATTDAPTSLTTATANTRLIRWDFCTATRTVSVHPSGMTALSGLPADPKAVHAWDQAQAAAGATGSKQATYTVGGSHWSSMAALREPVSSPPPDIGDVRVGSNTKDVEKIDVAVSAALKAMSSRKVYIGGVEKAIP